MFSKANNCYIIVMFAFDEFKVVFAFDCQSERASSFIATNFEDDFEVPLANCICMKGLL